METNTDSQPKKSLSRKKQLTKNEGVILKLCANDWNPFERANPSVLEKVMRESTKQRVNNYGEALL